MDRFYYEVGAFEFSFYSEEEGRELSTAQAGFLIYDRRQGSDVFVAFCRNRHDAAIITEALNARLK